MDRDARIFVAGHRGLVGGAICGELRRQGFTNVIVRRRQELDLLDASALRRFYASCRPQYVIVAAAKVGGIAANERYPADFLYVNLEIQNHLIHGAWEAGVDKLLFLGSSCIYPRLAPQPIQEEQLLSGPLEPTNQWYAIAKIAGIKLCQALRRQHGCDFICAMPCNVYGPNDNYDLESSHVLPALIRRFHEAKVAGARSVTCWGTGEARREFLYSDDLARACVTLMETYGEAGIINVGSGSDLTIRELAEIIARVVGFSGVILWDGARPDGTPRKLIDSSRIFSLGWRPRIDLETGIQFAYEDFLRRDAPRAD